MSYQTSNKEPSRTQPPTASQVERSLNRLDGAVESLMKSISALSDRIKPVLAPVAGEEGKKEEPNCAVPLAARLDNVSLLIENQDMILRRLWERVEL